MTEYNCFTGLPFPTVPDQYLSLVETLLGRKLEPKDNAPLPYLTFDDPNPPDRLPGDLTKDVEEEIRAKVYLALGSMPVNWESLGETERVPWLEASIEKRTGGTPEAEGEGKLPNIEQQQNPAEPVAILTSWREIIDTKVAPFV